MDPELFNCIAPNANGNFFGFSLSEVLFPGFLSHSDGIFRSSIRDSDIAFSETFVVKFLACLPLLGFSNI